MNETEAYCVRRKSRSSGSVNKVLLDNVYSKHRDNIMCVNNVSRINNEI